MYFGGQHRTTPGLWLNWTEIFQFDPPSSPGPSQETTSEGKEVVDYLHVIPQVRYRNIEYLLSLLQTQMPNIENRSENIKAE